MLGMLHACSLAKLDAHQMPANATRSVRLCASVGPAGHQFHPCFNPIRKQPAMSHCQPQPACRQEPTKSTAQVHKCQEHSTPACNLHSATCIQPYPPTAPVYTPALPLKHSRLNQFQYGPAVNRQESTKHERKKDTSCCCITLTGSSCGNKAKLPAATPLALCT